MICNNIVITISETYKLETIQENDNKLFKIENVSIIDIENVFTFKRDNQIIYRSCDRDNEFHTRLGIISKEPTTIMYTIKAKICNNWGHTLKITIFDNCAEDLLGNAAIKLWEQVRHYSVSNDSWMLELQKTINEDNHWDVYLQSRLSNWTNPNTNVNHKNLNFIIEHIIPNENEWLDSTLIYN